MLIHNFVHLYWRFSSASHAPSVPENEADSGEDDNPEMIITFQLGVAALGNVPPPSTFLLARDLILRQFSIDCCQNAFASGALPRTPLGAYSAPPKKSGSHTLILRSADTAKMNPPFPNPGYGPVTQDETSPHDLPLLP